MFAAARAAIKLDGKMIPGELRDKKFSEMTDGELIAIVDLARSATPPAPDPSEKP